MTKRSYTVVHYHPVLPFSFKSPSPPVTELKVGRVFLVRGGLSDKW